MSDDGLRAISVIGFIGCVFSPWYHWSGRTDPANHVCMNVATYGPGGRFAMTDRGRDALRQSADRLRIGPSEMHWTGSELRIDIDEIASPPLVSRMRGRVVLTPRAVTDVELPLSEDGAHVWRPFAPVSRIRVDLDAPGWQFSGHGYFDGNFGTRTMEEDFSYWSWGRFPTKSGATVFYDAQRRDGSTRETALTFDAKGGARVTDAPPNVDFARSNWRLRRRTRADAGTTPKQIKPMLDAPFYNRAVVETVLGGERVRGVYEALDLDLYGNRLLKPMYAMRVPRRRAWSP